VPGIIPSRRIRDGGAAIGLLLLGSALWLRAGDEPKYTISQVMKALHKGEDSLGNKVSKGQGTKEDFAKLVEYYSSLPLDTPPEGDDASWKTKTTALLDAAKALRDGKEGALAQYNKAVNCKACHSVHRTE
jgi:cytochrome c553